MGAMQDLKSAANVVEIAKSSSVEGNLPAGTSNAVKKVTSTLPALSPEPTEQTYLALTPIDFQSQSIQKLSAQQRSQLAEQLAVLNSSNAVEVRLEVTGGKAGGAATTARLREIQGAVEEVLKKPVTIVHSPLEGPGSLHVLKPHLYFSQPEKSEQLISAGATEDSAEKKGGSIFSGLKVSPLVTTSGIGLRLEKPGSPWSVDGQADLGNRSGIAVAVTREVGDTKVLGKDVSVRVGPYVSLQSGGPDFENSQLPGSLQANQKNLSLEAGGQVSLEGEGKGRFQPTVKVGLGTDGLGVSGGIKIRL